MTNPELVNTVAGGVMCVWLLNLVIASFGYFKADSFSELRYFKWEILKSIVFAAICLAVILV